MKYLRNPRDSAVPALDHLFAIIPIVLCKAALLQQKLYPFEIYLKDVYQHPKVAICGITLVEWWVKEDRLALAISAYEPHPSVFSPDFSISMERQLLNIPA